MITSSHLLLSFVVAINLHFLLVTSSPIESRNLITNGQTIVEFDRWIEPHLTRSVRMLEQEEADKAEGDGDEAKKQDQEKEEVDDDLKSDEVKEDQDEEKDDEDNRPDKDDDSDADDEVKSQADHKLLILLVDGFRYDYVKRDPALKGFPRMAKNGVYAKEVNPVHPSKSYPNWYSIATGLFAESHGFIDNHMRDKSSGELFLMAPHPNASNEHWWTQAEPLWVTAEKHRIKTAVYGWDGCQVRTESKKRPPITFCEPYDGYLGKKEKERFRSWLGKITEDFKDHKYRLAMVYYENIDYTGHKYGPQSRITKQAVRDFDEMLYDLQDMFVKNDLEDEVNVYVISDHGMISTKKFKQIQLADLVDMNDIELVLGMGSHMQILAERGKHSQVYKKLRQANVKGLNVYEKSSIPERFHLRGHRNLLPIYLTTDKGYQIVPPVINSKVFPDGDPDDDGDQDLPKGNHGYDPDYVDEMKTIMYAYGPDITEGEVIEEMDQVDHYNLFCQLLNLEPKPNNGTTEMFKQILNKFANDDENKDKDAEDDDDSKEETEKKNKASDDGDGNDDDDDEDNGVVRLTASFWFNTLFGIVFAIVLQYSAYENYRWQ